MISITCFILFFYLILQLSEKAIYYQKYIKQMTFESYNSLKQHCVKCPYSELFWSVFSCIRTEYGPE